jgi:hypothetical protein
MLPGFRFLFTAIILSMSILTFGLGAAALLRAAHEEFASNPTWRAPPETMFAQQNEPSKPVLAALVVDPPPAEQKPDTPVTAAAEAPAAMASLPAEPEGAAAPKIDEAVQRETARSEPPAETPSASEGAPAQASTAVEAPAPAVEARIAGSEASPPPALEAATAAPKQASVAALPEQANASAPKVDEATARIATLGGPPVAVETPPTAKPESSEADKDAAKKRLRAQRARERRRIATQRARLAQQAAQHPVQPAFNPFAQATTVAATPSPTPTPTPINPPHIR